MQILGLFSSAGFDLTFLRGDALNRPLKLVKLILPVGSILISHCDKEFDRLCTDIVACDSIIVIFRSSSVLTCF